MEMSEIAVNPLAGDYRDFLESADHARKSLKLNSISFLITNILN